MIRVFIADDHAFVRRGVRQFLEEAGGIEVVGEASDGRAVLHALEAPSFDVLLLDLSLPKINGPEVLHRLREQDSPVRVVVLSMYPEEQFAPPLLRAGASAYIGKDRPPDELVSAVRKAAASALPAGPPVERGAGLPHEALSAREHQVFLLLLQGLAVTEIAAEIDVRASTVSNHVAAIKAKLSARTIADVVRYAHRVGLGV